MKVQWQDMLMIILGLWVVFLIYMSTTLNQSSDSGAVSEQTQLHLMSALLQLDELVDENKKLYSIAKQLQKEMILDRHVQAKASNDQSINSAGDKNIKLRLRSNDFDLDEALSDFIAPSQSHELLRRAVIHGVNEQWLYISSQLRKIKKDLVSNSATLESTTGRLDEVLGTGADYRRALLRDLSNLTSLSDDWRKRESEDLSSIVQARIRHTQNPKDCGSARKLVCSLNKGCGYGCQIHHIIYCFLIAHGTGRTLILDSSRWRYSSGGWERYFLPLSDTCTDKSGSSTRTWGPNVENVQVVTLPIVDSLRPRPPYMPQAIPADLADRLIRLHGHPFVWWVGQFFKFLLRPQPALAKDMEQVTLRLNFQKPIVGVHIRRTDKLQSEAAYHGLTEYMTYVDEYFDLQDAESKMAASGSPRELSAWRPVKRRIYLASDDPSVISEAKRNYEHYEIISDAGFSQSAGLNSRYSDVSLRAVILDIHFLSLSDYLVCTFSSQVCRVAYEIMQTFYPDASSYFKSLDDIYYFGGQNGHSQIVIADHEARPNSNELDLVVGDWIGVAGNHWDGFSKGMNRRTGRTGIYPSYKVREHMDVVNYPTYSKSASNRTIGSGGR